MTKNRLLTLATVTVTALVPTMAMAHPGHGVGQNFVAGVMHPLTGLDHLLMIVAVSAWAGAMPQTGRFIVAVCLALFVGIGALLPPPVSGSALEVVIALTVVGSGILLAVGQRAPLWMAGALAASFALVHGFAHGTEGPTGTLAYVPGLAVATGGLALVMSYLAARLQSRSGWLRAAGVVGAAFGATALFTA